MRRVLHLLCLAVPAALHAQASAQPDTALKVTFGGFVDGYYAYDFNRPANLDRAYTTQAARHDEFNINLAFVDATLSAPRLRGRFAAQFGTAVQANYATEPRLGTLSGPDVSRFIQEAFVGYQVASSLWLDGGVFFSPFGSESWISRDNWNYTRSLIAEYSPYYEAGVKATWQATPALSAQLHVINGWQNISETNSDKALGVRVDYTVSPRLALAYDGFVGNEMPDTAAKQTRLWQEGIITLGLTDRLQLRGTFDYGTQQRKSGGGHAVWRGWATIARYQASPTLAVATRGEGYSDPEQVIVLTGQGYGLRATGWSVNTDVVPHPRLLWRTEWRGLSARDPLFPARSKVGGLAKDDPLLVTSLALTF
jgi:hypothetical protein